MKNDSQSGVLLVNVPKIRLVFLIAGAAFEQAPRFFAAVAANRVEKYTWPTRVASRS